MHVWAYKHDKLDDAEESAFVQHIFAEGYKVEKLAKKYLHDFILPTFSNAKLAWQHEYTDGDYFARSDAVIFDEDSNAYHIYEIKSSTSVKPENLYDATFQTLVCEAYVPIGSVSILHLNKDYCREGELDLEQLFVTDDVTDKVLKMREEVLKLRIDALYTINASLPDAIPTCIKPKDCPCLDLCHPGLPENSIFEIMGITASQKQHLLSKGYMEIASIPDDYPLKEFQQRQVQAVKEQRPIYDKRALREELDQLVFPLWFLDYESYLSAIPLWDKTKPQQQNIFQYSLHKLEKPDGELEHFEYLHMHQDEPAKWLLEQLSKELGKTGSVLVWNKTFEITRNKEMARMYPEYADFLLNLNERIYDLADSIKNGIYVHPDFHGSWSIKSVLPVLVPELSYENMTISKGDDAMMAWWDLVHGELSKGKNFGVKKQGVAGALLEYCKLDTLAMVEIWRKLFEVY
jgi:hypothetical protein